MGEVAIECCGVLQHKDLVYADLVLQLNIIAPREGLSVLSG